MKVDAINVKDINKLNIKNQKETKWERIVRQAISRQEEIRQKQKKKQMQEYLRKLRNWLSLPIILTLLAAITMIFRFGFHELEKVILSWIIGTSFISIIFAIFEARELKRK